MLLIVIRRVRGLRRVINYPICFLSDKLDGIKLGKRKRSPSPQTMEDFLQLAGESSRPLIPGQKRVSLFLWSFNLKVFLIGKIIFKEII